MNVSQPENLIKLPDDIQKAIEAGRNNVTVLTSEVNRLTKLRNSLNIDIYNLSGQQTELEKEKKNIESIIISHDERAAELQKLVDALTEAKTNINNDYKEVLKDIDIAKKEITERENKLIENEKDFTERFNNFKLTVKKVEEKKVEYETKIKKLREIVN